MRSEADIRYSIKVATDACVANKKKGVFGLFASELNARGACEGKAYNQYRAELEAAQQAEGAVNNEVNQALIDKLRNPNNPKMLGYIVLTFIFLIIVLIIVKF